MGIACSVASCEALRVDDSAVENMRKGTTRAVLAIPL